MDGQTPVRIEDRPTPETNVVRSRKHGPQLAMKAERLVITAVCAQSSSMKEAAFKLGLGIRTLQIKLRSYGVARRKMPIAIDRYEYMQLAAVLNAAPSEQEKALTPQTEVG